MTHNILAPLQANHGIDPHLHHIRQQPFSYPVKKIDSLSQKNKIFVSIQCNNLETNKTSFIEKS
jgi:hypothetical protein